MGRTLVLTSPHEKGKDVDAFQRALTRNGYYHGEVNGEYGPLTAQAAYVAKYWLGYGKPDHVAGDRLYGYLQGRSTSLLMKLRAKRRRAAIPKLSLGQKALAVGRKYIGVVENPFGSNHQQFGIWYGFDRVPWCAIYVTFCFVSAGSKAFVRGRDYSYVPNIDYDARLGRNNMSLRSKDTVQEGDVVTFDWTGSGIPDHVGIFVKWINKAEGIFASLEGNTSEKSHNNGGAVEYNEDRNFSKVHSFIHVGA